MRDSADPQAWVVLAEEDYKLARLSLRQRPQLTYGGCFHAQQCAEKYLKALLTHANSPFPKTHDLIALFRACEQAGIFIAVDEDSLSVLSYYAVQVRYPGEYPTNSEARDAVKTALVVRKFARQVLGLKSR